MAIGSNADTLKNLTLIVSRWENPSAWERVIQDDPLEPIEGHWVPSVGTNVVSTAAIPIGTTICTSSQVYRVESYSNFCTVPTPTNNSTWQGQEGQEPVTGLVRQDYEHVPRKACVPFARNRREERILKSLGSKVTWFIRKAEAKFGNRYRDPDKWNAEFWTMVTHADVRRKISKYE